MILGGGARQLQGGQLFNVLDSCLEPGWVPASASLSRGLNADLAGG